MSGFYVILKHETILFTVLSIGGTDILTALYENVLIWMPVVLNNGSHLKVRTLIIFKKFVKCDTLVSTSRVYLQ